MIVIQRFPHTCIPTSDTCITAQSNPCGGPAEGAGIGATTPPVNCYAPGGGGVFYCGAGQTGYIETTTIETTTFNPQGGGSFLSLCSAASPPPPPPGCGPGTDNSTCVSPPPPGCDPGTDNSTCTPPPPPTPDFSLTCNPLSSKILPGNTGQTTCNVVPLNGFTQVAYLALRL